MFLIRAITYERQRPPAKPEAWKGKVAQSRAALFGRKTTDCQRPTLSPREERVGREPERGDGFQKTPVFLSLVVISVMTFALLAPASAPIFDQSHRLFDQVLKRHVKKRVWWTTPR